MSSIVSSRVADTIARRNQEASGALVGYLPAGFPDLRTSVDAAVALAQNGVDVIELGLPYSDPVMDGTVIQAATQQALGAGFRLRDGFTAVREITAQVDIPVLVMTYWNPVLQYGVENFARDLADAGGAGLITPNLIPEEGAQWHAASDQYGLDRIYLVAPSSTNERIALTVDASRGFVYAASTMGVTGARDAVSDMAPELCARVREYSDIPIGVGLGVRNREQAAQIASYSDGVIVGSALVTAAKAGQDRLASLVGELAEGVRSRHAAV